MESCGKKRPYRSELVVAGARPAGEARQRQNPSVWRQSVLVADAREITTIRMPRRGPPVSGATMKKMSPSQKKSFLRAVTEAQEGRKRR